MAETTPMTPADMSGKAMEVSPSCAASVQKNEAIRYTYSGTFVYERRISQISTPLKVPSTVPDTEPSIVLFGLIDGQSL